MDTISLILAWNDIILQLSYVFTEPTTRTFHGLGPQTPSCYSNRDISHVGQSAKKHWTVYQKFFYRAEWSLKELSIAVLLHVIYPMIIESGVLDEFTGKPVADMAIDDTTVGRCGKHIAHAGWFKDASTEFRLEETADLTGTFG